MVSMSKMPADSWPKLNVRKTDGTKSSGGDITSEEGVTEGGRGRSPKQVDGNEQECEDYVQIPRYNRCFGDAIAAAMKQVTVGDQNGGKYSVG